MENGSEQGVLRIFVSSTDQVKQTPLYEYIVLLAKKENIAGATVLQGMLGYGATSVIHSYKFWEVSDKVPAVIEMVDNEERLRAFFEVIRPTLETMKYGCMATFDRTEVLLYKSGQAKSVNL